MLTKNLEQLRDALKIRAGVESSGTSVDLTPTVLNELVNDAVFEGWDLIVGKWLDYYTKSTTITVSSGTDTYSLPSDFYKLRRLWIADGTAFKRLVPIDLDALHSYYGNTVADKGFRYLLLGRNLQLAPVPSSSESLKLYYVPTQPTLVNDSDSITFDVPIELKLILAIGWRDILDRQELDPSPAIAKVQEYTGKLRSAADSRDAGEPFYLDPRGPRYDDDWDEVI